jgi:transcriptional regulator with XRE-family HTH domain
LDKIRELRTEKNMSQKDLAEKILNLTQQTISKYENGQLEPDIATLNAIADYFNVSTDYLFGRTKIKSYEFSKDLYDVIVKLELDRDLLNKVIKFIEMIEK